MTLDDLLDWAGETILNRGKGYVKRVDQLSRTQDSALVTLGQRTVCHVHPG